MHKDSDQRKGVKIEVILNNYVISNPAAPKWGLLEISILIIVRECKLGLSRGLFATGGVLGNLGSLFADHSKRSANWQVARVFGRIDYG